MIKLPLAFKDSHLFLEIEEGLWLFDTGAPTSFGESKEIVLDGHRSQIGNSYMGLSASSLSNFTGVECRGLLGADILGKFDHILDVDGAAATISASQLDHPGKPLALSEFMGIPILAARIGGADHQMFFDSGAQISYFQDDSITGFPSAGSLIDFFPGVGQFQTDTHLLPVSLGDIDFTLRCGTLPGLLGATLMMADVSGIIGNQLFLDRTIGYFPRRGALSL